MKWQMRNRSRQAGSAMVEYTIVTAVIGVALLTPHAATQNMPVAEYLAKAVRAFFRAYSLLVALF